MLDTYNFKNKPNLRNPFVHAWTMLNKHISVLFRATWQGKMDYLRFYRETIAEKVKRFIAYDLGLRSYKKMNGWERSLEMERRNISAVHMYKINPYPDRVVLFKALRGSPVHGPSNGWSEMKLGELIVHPLDCYHGSILFEPAVNHLANIINQYLLGKD